jgi:hypothetical protein
MLPPPSLHPGDGNSMALRNVGVLPQQYTASQPRRTRTKVTVSVLAATVTVHDDEEFDDDDFIYSAYYNGISHHRRLNCSKILSSRICSGMAGKL